MYLGQISLFRHREKKATPQIICQQKYRRERLQAYNANLILFSQESDAPWKVGMP